MKVKIRQDKKFITVDVNYPDCPKRSCFYFGYYTHHSAAGYSGCSFWSEKELSCLRRDKQGCP